MRKGKEWNLKRLSAVAMAAVFALAQPMGVLAAEEAQAAVNEGAESLITTADHGEETLVEETGAENTEDLLSSTGSDAETLVFAQTSVITGEDLDGVSVDDTDAAVKVTISQNGAYTLSGTWKNTYISIESTLKDGVELVLNDVTIDNTDLNSILGEDVPVIECGKKSPLTITLNGENEITGSSTYTTEPEALITVKKDGTIDIQGSGSLTLTDPMSDDTVEAAADAGLDPADGIKVGYGTAGGTFNMVSGTLTVDVQGDAIKAKNGNINILGGTVNTVTNGDGIKAKLDLEGEAEGSTGTGTVTIKDGTVNITSYGDGIQAENIDIQGGMVDITTLFDNASTGYYTSGSSYKSGYNTLYESSSSKIEYVAVDTGSHTGLKAGTKAKTAIYGYDITTNTTSSEATTTTCKASGGITISGGTINIDTRSTGIKANRVSTSGYTATSAGAYIIGSPDDGIKSDTDVDISGGTITINAGDDGIQAAEAVNITGGTVDITHAYEGIEGAEINIGVHGSSSGPSVSVYSADDGMNASSKTLTYYYESTDNEDYNYKKVSVSSSGGNNMNVYSGNVTVKIDSSSTESVTLANKTIKYTNSGDGLDCNGALALYGGTTKVYGQSSGDNSPVDTNDGFTLYKAATVFLTGVDGMNESVPKYGDGKYIKYGSSSGGGGHMSMSVTGVGPGDSSSSSLSAGSTFSIKSGSTTVISETLPYAASFVLYGSFTDSSSYTVTAGSSSTTSTPSSPSTSKSDSTTDIGVTGITLDQGTLEMEVGDYATLTATVEPSSATDPAVTWSSNDTSVATVNSKGFVKAVGTGSATITASAGDYSYTCSVVVSEAEDSEGVTNLTLSTNSITLAIGSSQTMTADVTPSSYEGDVTWESGDTAIATIDENGTVTAVAKGKTTLKAQADTFNSYCMITVVGEDDDVAVSSVTLDETSLSLKKGNTATLTATVLPADATNTNVTWKSSKESVATVSNGTVTAVAAGSATITVTSVYDTTKSASCTVTVTEDSEEEEDSDVAVTSVTLNKTTLSLAKGNTATLTATVTPSNATNKNVTWKSGNESVATVSNGTVTAVAAGTAVITVTSVSDTTKSASCTVTVTDTTTWESVRTEAVNTTVSATAGRFNDSSNTVEITFDSLENNTAEYTGKAITPLPTVTFNGVELKKNADYTVSYKSNKLPGTATVTVKGTGEFKNSKTATFTINKIDLSDCDIRANDVILKKEGKEVKTTLKVYSENGVLIPASNYIVTYENNTAAGTATATITAKANSKLLNSGYATADFEVLAAGTDKKYLISGAKVTGVTALSYTGEALEQSSVTVTDSGKTALTEGTDYDIDYKCNVNAGKATMIVTGTGDYHGVKYVTFTIKANKTLSDKITIELSDESTYHYTGYPIKPLPVVSYNDTVLTEGTDYKLSWSKNLNVTDAATLKVVLKGNISLTKTATFKIQAYDWSDITAGFGTDEINTATKKALPVFYYNGTMITLKKGKAYTPKYTFDKSSKAVSVTIKGAGPYKGQTEKTGYSYTYTGK